MRVQFSTLVLFASWTASVSCVSTKPSRPPQSVQNQAPSAKKPPALAKAGQKVQDPGDVAAERVKADLPAILLRLSDPSIRLMDEDVRVATSLHPSAPGSLEEAILVTTQMRLLKIQVKESGSFQARDLYETGGEQAAPPSASMEKLFTDLQIDLIAAFRNNTHLRNKGSIELAQELVERTKNSPAFDTELRGILDQEKTRLAATSAPVNEASIAPVPTDTGASDAGASAAEPPAVASPGGEVYPLPSGDVKTGLTDLKRTDAILMQAQRLADKGDFKQAIDSVARINAQDPFFEQAREKIRIFSNRAVQDLRQKAAQAFQNALPLSDSQAKQAYLVQAKALLEKALQDFPSAEQLDTVKENLAVIARDLDTIAKDSAPDGAAKSQ